MEDFDIGILFERGEVLEDVPGNSCAKIFEYICDRIVVPSGLTAHQLQKELVEREKVLSTAVGNGIAIPHPRYPLVKNSSESKIVVAYLLEPMDMQAPDVRKVYVMFVILSDSAQFHIKVLSALATLFKNEKFRKGIQACPSKGELLDLLRRISRPELL